MQAKKLIDRCVLIQRFEAFMNNYGGLKPVPIVYDEGRRNEFIL